MNEPSFFHAFPLIRSAKAAVVGTVLVSLPMLLGCVPLLGVYAALLMLLAMPTAVCLVGMTGGLLPMLVSAGVSLFSMWRFGGLLALEMSAVYLLPIMLVFIYCVSEQVHAKKTLVMLIVTHLLTLCCDFLLLRRIAQGGLYTWLGDMARNAVENWEYGDMLLMQLLQWNLVQVPEALAGTWQLGAEMPEAIRSDLLLSLRSLVSDLAFSLFPTLIVTQSMIGGVLTLLLPMRFGYIAQEKREFLAQTDEDSATRKEHKVDFPDLGMPPLSMWYIPRGMGWKAGVLFVGGSFLQGYGSATVMVMGTILYSVGSALFTVQGAGVMNFMQKSRGKSRAWRVIVPCLLGVLGILPYFGIADQLFNIRRLRKPMENKEDR